MSLTKKIAVLGGTGFLGRAIVRKLVEQEGTSVRVITRDEKKAPRNVEVVVADVVNGGASAMKDAVNGCDKVLNLIGLLFETPSRGSTFENAHVGVATALSKVLQDEQQLVHLSAIGVDLNSKSKYARTKAVAENILSSRSCILRPSIVYGEEDQFFNRFASMTNWSPFLPCVGGGRTKYQPVHVDDVAQVVVNALEKNDTGTFELGGKDIRSFRELMQMVLRVSGKNRALLDLPYSVAMAQGGVFEVLHKIVPNVPPLITRDQVELLKFDNVVTGACGFNHFDVNQRGCGDDDIRYIV